MSQHFEEWQPIRIYAQGIQPRTGRHWNCLPAWDVAALYREPDGRIRHPDYYRAQEQGASGEFPNKDEAKHVFWNRHVDRRFYIPYPHASRDYPRVQGRTIRETGREWETLVEYRDRYLQEAGLTPADAPGEIARCLAETFACEQFEKKPTAGTFDRNPREIHNAIEGLIHRSFCVGCAVAFAALADACGLPTRTIGCGAHRVAEVRVDGRWHLVDSVGRHAKNRGLDTFFGGSFMETTLDAMGPWGENLTDNYRNGLWRRPNGQYHFPMGMWDSPCTLRFGTSNAYAIYPGEERWGITSEDGRRLPIIRRSGGFYWPTVHTSDAADMAHLRASVLPAPMSEEVGARDYVYHPFRPGERLRQSIWLDSLDGMEGLEITLTFGASKVSDFSHAAGSGLVLRIGELERSLADMDAWPPERGDNMTSTVTVPVDVLEPGGVNWIELHQKTGSLLYVPCVPAVMEPYIAPLWSETEDRFNPPLA